MKIAKTFVTGAKKYLNSNGRVYMSYGKAGEMDKLEKLMKSLGYKIKITEKLKLGERIYVVYQLML